MSRMLAGVTVDDELYQTFTARRYDVTQEFKNLPLETVVSYRITCNNGNQRTLINP